MIARRTVFAVVLAAFGIGPIAAQQQSAPDPAAAPTPRIAGGHPDLNGWWGGNFVFGSFGKQITELTDEKGNINFSLPARSQGSALGTASGQLAVNFERDSGVGDRADPNKPIYKAEFWDKVQYLDLNGNAEDRLCKWSRRRAAHGFPNKIVATPTEVVFFMTPRTRSGGSQSAEHNPIAMRPTRAIPGDVDGDTLVIDTNNFNDQTWLDWPGYFHSDQLHVVEKVTRRGNLVTYEVTIDDPGVLQKPWVRNPRRIPLNTDPKAAFWEDPPCNDKDLEHIVTKERG
jgi:hypothetical protein